MNLAEAAKLFKLQLERSPHGIDFVYHDDFPNSPDSPVPNGNLPREIIENLLACIDEYAYFPVIKLISDWLIFSTGTTVNFSEVCFCL